MKASAEKSSASPTTATTKPANQAFFSNAPSGNFFAPANTLQMKLKVNVPGDKFEQEADKMADKVMRMPSPASSVKEEKLQRQPDEKLQKKAAMPEEKIQKAALPEDKLQKKEHEKLQRKETNAAPVVAPNVQSAIKNKATGGQALSNDVKADLESRFKADFSKVRIHNDSDSAKLNNQLGAKAFTHQNHIFFSEGQYKPGSSEGKQLLAHELTHTIQQGHAIQRSPQVSTTVAPPQIQRSGQGGILGWIADKANNIMGFRMFTIILGINPITMQSVDTGAANILRAMVEFIPGGVLISQALDGHGIFDKIAVWVGTQIKSLGMVGSLFNKALNDFIGTLSASDLLPWNWGGLWDRAVSIFSAPINRLIAFASGLVMDIITFIKDAILKPIAAYAKANTSGYPLLCSVMGKDPITGEKAPDDPEALMGGFMKFIGEEETWGNMKKANAIPRAFAWFNGAIGAVKAFVTEIPGLFIAAFKALEIADIILIPNAFVKIVRVFGSFAGRFISWGLDAIWVLLEIIFDAFKPGVMGYIKKTGAALKSILKNPLPFVGNLVKAAKQGFTGFKDRFGAHFKAGLIDWLTGSLIGVYIPKALSLPELGKLALSVLGITWAGIRKKLVTALGDKGEKIVSDIEKGVEWAIKGFEIVKKLAEGGMAAAWEMIQEKLADLKDQVISGITGFVTDTIVKKAIPKLIGMFIPGAGFIPAIVSIYDTIMVFVKKIAEIIEVVTAFIDSIVAIAAGNIGAAANRVEKILGGLLSLAISFLAGFLGLGKVTDKIKEVIDKIRDKVDKAIDAALAWVVAKAKALFAKVFGKKKNGADDSAVKKHPFTIGSEAHTLTAKMNGKQVIVTMASSVDSPLPSLISNATREINADTNRKPKDKEQIIKILSKASADVSSLYQDWISTGAKDPSGGKGTVEFDKFATIRLAQIANDLSPLGAYNIHALTNLFSVPKKRNVPIGYKIRKNLYDRGSQWTTISKRLRNDFANKIRPKCISAMFLYLTNKPKALTEWQELKNAKNIPDWATLNSFKPSTFNQFKYAVDHKSPLGQHWKGSGKNSDDATRRSETIRESNLEVLIAKDNLEKGGDKFDRDVGTGFTSEFAEGGILNAKTINGQPFIDDAGKPV